MPTDAEIVRAVAWHRTQALGHKNEAAYWRENATGIEAYANRERSSMETAAMHDWAADALEDLAATRWALDDALASAGEVHAENARLRAALEQARRDMIAVESHARKESILATERIDTALRDGGGDAA